MKPEARCWGGPVGWLMLTLAVPERGGLVSSLAVGRASRLARYSAVLAVSELML